MSGCKPDITVYQFERNRFWAKTLLVGSIHALKGVAIMRERSFDRSKKNAESSARDSAFYLRRVTRRTVSKPVSTGLKSH